eukprot:gnl/TRDRNA2_/TRDRNA2_102476_c1_seq2.p1 gnl/TRDRNA2_/TRDRNA2_102476_c1~~gnl/TRDRNA2_/TRDRNA2_102476_c1_seq2.p1  ORF type:complete len:177 (-),score=17.54 gnl/TRDRNA2_/TRDRNA2_102476_c1_seq2:19-549(-)
MGHGMRFAIELLKNQKITFRKFWGFDAFKGLPTFTAKDEKLSKGIYEANQYNPQNRLTVMKANTTSEELVKRIAMRHINYVNAIPHFHYHYSTEFIQGFFNDTLTPTLATERGMKPALFVDLDCDIYESTYQALDWLFGSGLMAQAPFGTYVYFDDWFSPPQREAKLDVDAWLCPL